MYSNGIEFGSQSQKTRYFKIIKELQLIKGKMVDNPKNKSQIASAFVQLYTRYTPSEEETSKFIDFIFQGKVIPSTLNFKDALLYMLTYDSNFDLNEKDEYGVGSQKVESNLNSNISSHRSQSNLKTKFKLDFKGSSLNTNDHERNYRY